MTNMFPIVILAGGLGTRLFNLTSLKPKSLVEINKIPFVEHQLLLLQKHGFFNIIMALGHYDNQIVNYINNRDSYGLNIIYSFDGSILRGTGGAVTKIASVIKSPFFVIYGDSYLDTDYLAIQNAFINNNKNALLTLYKNNNEIEKSNIEYENGRIISYNKYDNGNKKYIDYGLSIFNTNCFDNISDDIFDLCDIYKMLIDTNDIGVYIVNNRFYEIGSLKGILELENFLNSEV